MFLILSESSFYYRQACKVVLSAIKNDISVEVRDKGTGVGAKKSKPHGDSEVYLRVQIGPIRE